MKLGIVNPNATAGIQALMSLESRGNGVWEKPITLVLTRDKNGNPALTAQTTIRLTATAERSKGRVTRILRKLEIPYQALYPTQPSGVDSALAFSPSRSGKFITKHSVITIPKEVYEDLAQQKAGSTGSALAVAQLRLVHELFGSIDGWYDTTTAVASTGSSATGVSSHAVYRTSGSKDASDGIAWSYNEQTNEFDITGVTKAYTATSPNPNDMRTDNKPVLRGLLGHAPWDQESKVGEELHVSM